MSGTGFTSRRWSCRYSQARTAMGMSVHLQGSGSRLPVAVVCLGAVALLYAGSFYTRDWRPVVHQAGRPLTETVSARSTVAAARPMTLDAKPAEVPARIAERTTRAEPEVTGAVPRGAEPIASSPAAAKVASSSEQAGPSSEASPPRLQAAAAKPVVHHTRLRTQGTVRQPRVQYARLRAQPAAWRQTVRVRAPRTAVASHGSPSPTAVASHGPTSPIAQLFQFFLPGRVN